MRILVLCCLLLLTAPLRAEEVDVELFLAVDVSRSMSPAELEIQRRGYAEALRSDEVIAAIEGGLIGQIALTYVEWAGSTSQREVVPWTLIRNRAEAEAFARRIETHFDPGLRRTSISGALRYAAEGLRNNEFIGLRQVIDVSGDGPNNSGAPVLAARRVVLERGITINGLPLMTRDGLGVRWHLEDLDLYYASCVIGGPGAFSIPVRDWSEFAGAVRKKLVWEIAGERQPRLWHAQHIGAGPDGYDCMIGEKIWERNRRFWEGP
ncbi:DUF1194 domain-containing protein [Ovoidimarina sediminis]|uniref:DUF1194 domain-containing protein n=1 Tax=Ovoidimarina sediminis TaxID=3079856 RepID=UPI0029128C09|nr:DUF1194 domain-containing protein [Rhodophyticola sp. MJ-SS7]MDU8945317.1 DUF1194 domain-containing protein [Rhodophyticola sp. MJ-SS7]